MTWKKLCFYLTFFDFFENLKEEKRIFWKDEKMKEEREDKRIKDEKMKINNSMFSEQKTIHSC